MKHAFSLSIKVYCLCVYVQGTYKACKGTNTTTRIHGQATCTVTHGSVSAYDRSEEDWTSYIEHLNFYFAANDVTAETKK